MDSHLLTHNVEVYSSVRQHLEKTLESPLDCKEIQPVHSKGDQSWVFFGRSDAKAETPCEELTHWKRLWCWEGLGAGGEGDDRGWDGWMASQTRGMWVWVNSGSWWWTGGLACCDSCGRKESDTSEQLNWTEWTCIGVLTSMTGCSIFQNFTR